MYTTGPNGYSTNSGTSMAAPVVSGGAAILKSQFPSFTNAQIINLIKTTADDISVQNPSYINQLGAGRLNLFNAVSGIEEENNKSVKIYPNPTRGLIIIQSDEKIKSIIVRNVLGELVKISNSSRLDISNHPNGVYFVDVITSKSKLIKKVVLSN